MRLTEAGREMLERTTSILAMLEGSVEAVRSVERGERRILRLGYYGPSFYNNLVTRTALERFRTEAPDAEIVSHELFSEEQVEALREERIDVGISRGEIRTTYRYGQRSIRFGEIGAVSRFECAGASLG